MGSVCNFRRSLILEEIEQKFASQYNSKFVYIFRILNPWIRIQIGMGIYFTWIRIRIIRHTDPHHWEEVVAHCGNVMAL